MLKEHVEQNRTAWEEAPGVRGTQLSGVLVRSAAEGGFQVELKKSSI